VGRGRIEEAWDDLSQGKSGIIFTIWDSHRLLWFADPVGMDGRLSRFLRSDRLSDGDISCRTQREWWPIGYRSKPLA